MPYSLIKCVERQVVYNCRLFLLRLRETVVQTLSSIHKRIAFGGNHLSTRSIFTAPGKIGIGNPQRYPLLLISVEIRRSRIQHEATTLWTSSLTVSSFKRRKSVNVSLLTQVSLRMLFIALCPGNMLVYLRDGSSPIIVHAATLR